MTTVTLNPHRSHITISVIANNRRHATYNAFALLRLVE